jgi:hypothetical protein
LSFSGQARCEGVNELRKLLGSETFPSLQRRGGCGIKKKIGEANLGGRRRGGRSQARFSEMHFETVAL